MFRTGAEAVSWRTEEAVGDWVRGKPAVVAAVLQGHACDASCQSEESACRDPWAVRVQQVRNHHQQDCQRGDPLSPGAMSAVLHPSEHLRTRVEVSANQRRQIVFFCQLSTPTIIIMKPSPPRTRRVLGDLHRANLFADARADRAEQLAVVRARRWSHCIHLMKRRPPGGGGSLSELCLHSHSYSEPQINFLHPS